MQTLCNTRIPTIILVVRLKIMQFNEVFFLEKQSSSFPQYLTHQSLTVKKSHEKFLISYSEFQTLLLLNSLKRTSNAF